MTKIFAHRGASGYAPENTLSAFALAAEQGADGVELDVHLSMDGEIMVIHDEKIDRTSTGRGKVVEMTLAELKQYRYGAGMAAYADEAIPTLREVYELLKPTRLHINVELKTDDEDYEGIEAKCIALAEEMGMTDRVLYSSFNHYSLLTVKEINAHLPCGLLYGEKMVEPWHYAKRLGMEALHPQFRQLKVLGFVDGAHAEGILVNPWTVNQEKDLRKAITMGADYIITNYPDKALAILNEHV